MALRFVLLDPIAINPSKRYKARDLEVVHAINRELAAINRYRCRSYMESLSSNLHVDLDQDVRFREDLASELNHEKFQKNLKSHLVAYWVGASCSSPEIQRKTKALQQVFCEMRRFHKLMHLTACELAVVALTYANFKDYFELHSESLYSSDLSQSVHKLKDAMCSFEQAIVLCMEQHLRIFALNQGAHCYQDCLPPSDILHFYYNRILELVGHGSKLLWPQGLLVDDSLLYKMPDLPFEVEQGLNAKVCFESFIRNYYAASGETQGITGVLDEAGKKTLDLVSGTWGVTKTVLSTPVWLAQQGVDVVSGWTSSPETARKNQESPSEKAALSGGAVIPTESNSTLTVINEKMSLLQKATSKLLSEHSQQLKSDQKFAESRRKISDRIKELDHEIQRWSFGCFSFFFKSKISLKKQKVGALKKLLKCDTGDQLYTEVSSILSDKAYAPVVQGFFSSTQKVLEQIKSDLSKSLNA